MGAGGILAEVYQDVATRRAPVSVEEAEAMIAAVKGFAILRGFRGLPQGDVRALAQAVAALSHLALIKGRPVAEADINPVIVKRADKPQGALDKDGAVAVDGLVVMKE